MKGMHWVAAVVLLTAVPARSYEPRVEKLSEHAYAYLTGAGSTNAGFIVTDEGVLIIDTMDTVVHAEELLAEIRKVSTAPLQYAVNTCFHYNHVTGNQVLLKNVKAILGHEQTRRHMFQEGESELAFIKQNYALIIEQHERALREDPLTDAERADVERQLADAKKSLFALERTRLTPPTATMTAGVHRFYLGGLEIQVHFLGRGYTDGDLVVFLPSEKVIYTGDLFVAQSLPWLRGSFIREWSETLDEMLKLDVDKIVPGTGGVASRDDLIAFKGYLSDLYTEVKNLWDQGVPKDDIRWKVDLSAYQNWTNYDEYLRYNLEDSYDEIDAARRGP